MKRPFVDAETFLPEEDRTVRSELNQRGNGEKQGRQHHQQRERDGQIEDALDDQRPSIAHTGVSGDVVIAVEFLGARAGGLQAKNIGGEAHDHAVLLAQRGDLRGMFVERAQRQINRDFIHHVAAQILGQAGVVAADFVAGGVECVHPWPSLRPQNREVCSRVPGWPQSFAQIRWRASWCPESTCNADCGRGAERWRASTASRSRDAITASELIA